MVLGKNATLAAWRAIWSAARALQKARQSATDEKVLIAVNNALADLNEAAELMAQDIEGELDPDLASLLKT